MVGGSSRARSLSTGIETVSSSGETGGSTLTGMSASLITSVSGSAARAGGCGTGGFGNCVVGWAGGLRGGPAGFGGGPAGLGGGAAGGFGGCATGGLIGSAVVASADLTGGFGG